MAENLNRRRFMKTSLLGVTAGLSLENQTLLARLSEGGAAQGKTEPVKGLPQGKLGKLQVSRLLCGGNLFSGFAHSRELIYVSALMKEYFTPEKIMDTLEISEKNGINSAILRCDEHIIGVLKRYRKERGGKIQWIAQTYPTVKDLTSNIQMAIDNGAVAAYAQGGIGDGFVKSGQVDLLGKVVSFIKQNGLVAGVGSHSLDVPKATEREKIDPDFYFKTFNKVDYYSEKPEEVAAFFKDIDKPWIAFKVLGAGATEPREGFELAYRLGADFLNIGMFDFQVQDDAAIAKEILTAELNRERPWRS
ncbi:MAG TPA: hypothetical protein VM123_21265 [archaeon]|nr:hypothetical protein [archaeon]